LQNRASVQKSLAACQTLIYKVLGARDACGAGAHGLEIYRSKMNDRVAESRVRLKIAGRVQGVYYRASTVQQAQVLGLTGWVKNCPDGSVEAVAEGIVEKIEELIAWCRNGPAGARVTEVSVEWQVAEGAFRDFSIKR
jgi:acylphosphatase